MSEPSRDEGILPGAPARVPLRANERAQGAPSLHSQIIADIETKILGGEWPPGRRIPYEHELTELYGCSRMTVSKALTATRPRRADRAAAQGRQLRDAPARASRRCSRSATSPPTSPRSGSPIASRCWRGESDGRRGRTGRASTRPQAQPLLAVVCRHDAGALPFCHEDRLISLAAAPSAADEPFAALSPGAWLAAE